MYWIFWLIAGAALGIVIATRRRTWQDRLIDLAAGMGGALLGGLVFVALRPPRDAFLMHMPSLLASVIGTLLLIGVVHLIRRPS